MSVALQLVVRTDGQPPAAVLLGALVRVVDALPGCSRRWERLTLRSGRRQTSGGLVPGHAMTAAEVGAVLAGVDGDDVSVGVSTVLAGDRYPWTRDRERDPGVLPLRLTCWGPASSRGAEPELGQAELTFDPVWPFLAPGGTAGGGTIEAVTANNDRLFSLLAQVVLAVDPVAVRAHTDDGAPIPVNAHFVYYRDITAVQDDLAWIERLWWQGSPIRGLEPLVEPSSSPPVGAVGERDWRLHEWRPPGQAARVRKDLARLVSAMPRIGLAQIVDVMVAGTCPVVSLAPGFVVTVRGRQMVDGFVDRFYTELVDLAELD